MIPYDKVMGVIMKTIVPAAKITVSSRGQFVIPKEVRDACGIHGGSEILVRTREDGVIELCPLKRNVSELFERLPITKGPALNVDSAIIEAVLENDDRTKIKTKRRS